MVCQPPDSVVLQGHEVSSFATMYNVATGHGVGGTSSSVNSELRIGASTE